MSEEDNHNKREAKEAEAGEQQPAVRLFSFFYWQNFSMRIEIELLTSEPIHGRYLLDGYWVWIWRENFTLFKPKLADV